MSEPNHSHTYQSALVLAEKQWENERAAFYETKGEAEALADRSLR